MKKIPIWGNQIPYNRPDNKRNDMEIGSTFSKTLTGIRFIKALIDPYRASSKKVIDTFTYMTEIRPGHQKETYEDVPYLVPFPVAGSQQAVIIVPGGGLCYLSTDTDEEGHQGEGDLVAKALNERGVSAFVLWYRHHPYHFPAPYLDLQRTVRYLRFHAEEFGFDPDRIGAVGFSAGGYTVMAEICLAEGKNLFPHGYSADEVDGMSDRLNFAAPIYPALSLHHNPNMVFACFPKERAMDERERAAMEQESNLLTHINPRKLPYFTAYGTKDTMVSLEELRLLTAGLKEAGCPVTAVPVEGAGHGFGAAEKEMKRYGYWLEQFVDWVKQQ